MPGTRKLGKTTDQRKAMLRQQVTDFLDNGRMETTVTRAKEIKPLAEKMITLGKKGDLAAYRQALSFITRETVAHKLFKEIAPEYAQRNGGEKRPWAGRNYERPPCKARWGRSFLECSSAAFDKQTQHPSFPRGSFFPSRGLSPWGGGRRGSSCH